CRCPADVRVDRPGPGGPDARSERVALVRLQDRGARRDGGRSRPAGPGLRSQRLHGNFGLDRPDPTADLHPVDQSGAPAGIRGDRHAEPTATFPLAGAPAGESVCEWKRGGPDRAPVARRGAVVATVLPPAGISPPVLLSPILPSRGGRSLYPPVDPNTPVPIEFLTQPLSRPRS